MKTFSFIFIRSIFSFVLLSVFFSSCFKEKKVDPDLNSNLSSENKIISFELINSDNEDKNLRADIPGIVVDSDFTVSLKVPSDAIFEGLKVKVVVSENASISPENGSEVTFDLVSGSNPEVYTKVFKVTAQDGSVQDYAVNITKSLFSDRSITSFVLEKSKNVGKIFSDRIGLIDENATPPTIILQVSDAATLTDLKPTIVKSGNSVSPDNEVAVSFTNNSATDYKVTSGDGQEKIYKVTVIQSLSSNNKISEFAFTKDNANNTGLKLSRSSTGTRASDVIISDSSDGRTGTIAVKASSTATITELLPNITKHERATISPAISAYDYSNSKVYTVTAQDGQTRDYTVSVSKSLSNDKNMTSFIFEHAKNTEKSLNSKDYSAGTINSTPDSDVDININLPYTVSNLNGLKPTIALSHDAIVNPESETPQDFIRGTAKRYVVTAQDGTTKNYDITIPVLQTGVEITSLKIKQSDHSSDSKVRFAPGVTEVEGDISNTGDTYKVDIILDGDDDASVTLKPEITLSAGASVDPTSGTGMEFTYGTAQTYTVTAENGSTRAYSITVKSSNSKLKSFGFKTTTGNNSGTGKIVKDISGVINHTTKTVTVKVPHNAELNALTPEVLGNKGSTVTLKTGGGSANTAQDFSSQKTYTVTAQDGKSTTDYTVNVSNYAEPRIETFKFSATTNSGKKLGGEDIIGVINHNSGDTPGEIILKVPHDAEISDLTPEVVAATTPSGIEVYKESTGTQNANSSNDFSSSDSSPKKYSAVDPAGGRKTYNVKVFKAPAITEFKFTSSANGSASFPSGTTEYTGIVTDNSLTAGTITVTIDNTVTLTSLKPDITVSNGTVSPTDSESKDFSSETTYTVMHSNDSNFTKTYTVSVNKSLKP
ncbi:DUF5018 domain-containing protein [Ichthyobacterium seriolicida]|uniref:Pkd domain containing protein n=1 Tax=Ichthyobacterium seriolicida TaxID=242600 RepID=A0A1J1E4G8_9FLAO|nr:hypothetical protein [Ichthyobacterium seriolicida]BAV94214.1 pkd domain containing protein [Ichthyobacterium seriolicida]